MVSRISRVNLCVVIVTVVALLVLCGSAPAFSGAGWGTESAPHIITNVQQLQQMSDDLGACYALGNDVDASDTRNWNGGAGFEPIGSDTEPFTGRFDGRRHRVTQLYINRPSTDGVGLFGYIKDGAVVKNVGLAEVDITARRNSGPLVGSSSGSMVCYSWSTGSIRGSHDYQMRLGGLIGISSGANSHVNQCFSSVNVTATGGAHQVGGLAGYNGHGSIMTNCYATGNVSGTWKVGGLVGDNPYPEGGYIARCYSTGKVTGTGGGLVGFNFSGGVTQDSYWDGETSGKTSSYGGTGKTTVEMMQKATFVNWDFEQIWYIWENESYPLLGPVDPGAIVVYRIRAVIAEKEAVAEEIEAAMERERAAYNALEKMLQSGEYGDLSYSSVVSAKERMQSAMELEQQAIDALERSIKELYEALAALGIGKI